MNEIWKDVVGYEGIYEVSNKGRVRTHKDKVSWSKRYQKWRHWKQRYLKDKTPNGRDVRVALWKDGKPNYYLVHRLVAYAFIPKIEGMNSINHIDGNPKNNSVENLEWCNHERNNNHAFDNGLINTSTKITLLRIEDNKTFNFRSMAKASLFLGRNKGYVSKYLNEGETNVRSKDNRYYKIIIQEF